jgi:putative NADPH-quinone reductase
MSQVEDQYVLHDFHKLPSLAFVGPLLEPSLFNYGKEVRHAYRNNCQSEDISNEIDKLKRADMVIFQFPLYWFSVPAILKGWFDRVLCESFAFDFESQNVLDKGFMKVHCVCLIVFVTILVLHCN